MITAFQRLQRSLTRPAHTYRPTSETFPDLDTQQLAKDLELTDRGKDWGGDNLPPTDGANFDSIEAELLEHIGATQKRAHDVLENHLAGFRQRLVELDFEQRFSDVKAISASGLSDLKAELQIGVDRLHGLRRDLTDAERWGALFRKRNHLERPCKITTPKGDFYKWLLIVMLVLVELIVNGELLSKNNALGLVGGIIEAIIFAVLNVGISVLFALNVLPYLTHRNWLLKFLGLVGLGIYVAFAIGLNLSLAHYRELSGAIIDPEVGNQILNRVLIAPLGLEEFRSWLLFALGIVFSIIAMIDGLHMRDVYPGYSAADKALRTARAKYAGESRAAIEDLIDVRDEHEELLRISRGNLSKLRTEHDAIIAHRARIIELFNGHQNQLEKAANALLQVYRDANIEARSDAPPERFLRPFDLKRIAVSLSKEGDWNSSELQASIKDAQAGLDKLLRALGKQFDEALARYRELDVLVPDAT